MDKTVQPNGEVNKRGGEQVDEHATNLEAWV